MIQELRQFVGINMNIYLLYSVRKLSDSANAMIAKLHPYQYYVIKSPTKSLIQPPTLVIVISHKARIFPLGVIARTHALRAR